MNQMKKYLALALAILLVLASQGCSKIKQIDITSYRLEKISPLGLNSIDAILSVGIHNPANEFTVTDGTIVIYRLGNPLGTVTIRPVVVEGRVDGQYPVSGNLTLAPGVGILNVLSLSRNFDEEEYSLDLFARVKLKGAPKVKIDKKNIPLTRFNKF